MSSRSIKPRRGAAVEAGPSAQFYRQVAETIPHMAWSARPDGSIEYFNARVYEYTGRTQRQLQDWGWRSVVHPDDWERCIARWTKAFAKGQPYEVEYRLKRRDGKHLWHLGAAMPLREGGRIVRWVGTSTDIENQKRAERLLEKAREALGALVGSRAEELEAVDARFHSLVDSATTMVWESGPDKLCTYLNRQWLDFTGRSMKQELGAGWMDVVHPDDLQGCLSTYHSAFDAREPFEMEYRMRRHDGRYRWISDRGMPVVDPVRGFRGYIGSCLDVTERRTADPHRPLEQEKFRAFLDSLPAVAWIKDSRLRYTWVSGSYQRVFGKSLTQMQGRDNSEIWPAELARQYRSEDHDALRANGPVQSINDVPCADGSIVRLLVVKFPLLDSSGEAGVAAVGYDISTRDGELPPADAQAGNPLARLSARERQVLQMIVDGSTSAQAGQRLGLSPKSIDTYRSRIMTKLDIPDLPALVKFAIRHRITTVR